MITKPDCLRPGCTRVAESRGLCKVDYSRARNLVARGRTTWQDLEARGKVLPKGTGAVTRWFLER